MRLGFVALLGTTFLKNPQKLHTQEEVESIFYNTLEIDPPSMSEAAKLLDWNVVTVNSFLLNGERTGEQLSDDVLKFSRRNSPEKATSNGTHNRENKSGLGASSYSD